MFHQAYMQLGHHLLGSERLVGVDVGGANGLIPHWQKFQGFTDFYVYEPHEESFNKLQEIYRGLPFENDFHFIQTALSGTDGLRKFYSTNVPTGSSLLKPNVSDPRFAKDPYFVPFRESLIRTQTLSQSLDAEGVDLIDAIKLDVQGAELEILKGLDERRLNNLLLVELEAGLVDCYEGLPSLSEIQQFLVKHGLELYDIRTQRGGRTDRASGETYTKKYFGRADTTPTVASKINEIDLVFMRTPAALKQSGTPAQLRKLIACQCVFNFLSEAIYMTTEAETASMLPEVDRAKIYEVIRLWHAINVQQLEAYDTLLKAVNYQVWGQYTWVPYPCA